jgi:hypothetical protein
MEAIDGLGEDFFSFIPKQLIDRGGGAIIADNCAAEVLEFFV